MCPPNGRETSCLPDCCACCTKGIAEKSVIKPICCGCRTVLKALISDHLEFYQTLTLKAVKMKLELFDKLKELEV